MNPVNAGLEVAQGVLQNVLTPEVGVQVSGGARWRVLLQAAAQCKAVRLSCCAKTNACHAAVPTGQ